MPETIKSVLFVDYDSISRSLKAASPQAAERFGERAGAWLAALEGGRLASPRSEDGARRRILMKRCYADPKRLGKHRAALAAAGFEMIECPQMAGHERNAADINMSLDALDALEHPTGYDEFILLSADADLTAVLLRLRAHNRTTVIYAGRATAQSYKAAADSTVEEVALTALLNGADQAADAEQPAFDSRPARAESGTGERADIEALARKISAGTNVPLFAPRTYADLFRVLTEEIASNGYHFQSTAENVATKLTASGRNATRRQVVFVVKGLALKGHVFSTTDTPETLAEVFREQVLYLAGNAGIELDDREKALLSSWIIGHATPSTAAALERPKQAAEAPPPKAGAPKNSRRRAPKSAPAAETEAATPKPAPARPAAPTPAPEPRPAEFRAIEPKPEPRPALEPRPATISASRLPEPPKRPAFPPPKPVEAPKPAPAVSSKPVETPKFQPFASRLAPLARPPATSSSTPPAPAKPPSILSRPTPPPVARPALTPARPPLAATPAAASPSAGASGGVPPTRPAPSPLRPASLTPGATAFPPRPLPTAPATLRPALPATPAAKAPPLAPSAPPRPTPAPPPAAKAEDEPDKEAIESSILAAIARAVDVLVENSGNAPAAKTPAPAPPAPKKVEPPPAPVVARRPEPVPAPAPAQPPAATEPKPEPPPSEPGDSDDIGDEIQRIIASYSRNRQSGGERR